MSLKDWFKEPPPKIERKGKRHPAPSFAVIHPSGTTIREDAIKDISATGVYLLTSDRWEPGTQLGLTLHRKNIADQGPANEFMLQAKVVRCGQDGVALSFDLPKDIDPLVWVSLVEGASGEAGPEDIVGHFKMAKAVSFLSRICPDAEKDFRQRVCTDLSSGRFKHAVEIALKADCILSGWPGGEQMTASPKLLAGILEYGSWAEDDGIQEYWAALMALACTPERDEDEYLELVERASQFAPIHFKIFTIACVRANKVLTDGVATARPLIYSTDEVLILVGSRDLGRVERELMHLHDLGLFMSKNVPSSYVPVDELNLGPTHLGLELFARFHAHRGTVESFYGLTAPEKTSLAKA